MSTKTHVRQVRRGGPTATPVKSLPPTARLYSTFSGWANSLETIVKNPGVWHSLERPYAAATDPETVLRGAIERTKDELGHLNLTRETFDLATAPTNNDTQYILYLRTASKQPAIDFTNGVPRDDTTLGEHVANLNPDSDEYVSIVGAADE